MALSVLQGSFARRTTVGDDTISVGFTPKFGIFWTNIHTATGFTTTAILSMGISDGTNHYSIHAGSADGSSGAKSRHSTKAISANNVGGTLSAVCTVAFSGTDAVFSWSTAEAIAQIINYIFIGGDAIDSVKVGNYVKETDTGDDPLTGVGFQPDLVMLFTIGTTTGPDSDFNTVFGIGIGAFDGAGNQSALANTGVNSVGNRNSARYFAVDKCLITIGTTGTATNVAHFTSMDADGFTINYDTNSGTGMYIGYLAVKMAAGYKALVVNDSQPTSATTKDTATAGMTPAALFLASAITATAGSGVTDAEVAVGASDGTNESTVFAVDDSGAEAADRYLGTTKAIAFAHAGSPAAVVSEADASFAAEKFTLNWTTAEAVANKFLGIAFGTNTSTAVRDLIGGGLIPFAR